MSQSKRTPAPWFHQSDDGRHYILNSTKDQRIALVVRDVLMSKSEVEANGILLGESPAILECLKEMTSLFSDLLSDLRKDVDENHPYKKSLRIINKVEGIS